MTTKEPDNKVPPFEAFLLGQLAGICSDIADTAVKIMQDGFDTPPPDSSKTNRERLANQLGRVISSVAIFCSDEVVDEQLVTKSAFKYAKDLDQFLNHDDKGNNHDKRNGGS